MNEYRKKLLKEININKPENFLSKEEWFIISCNGELSDEFMREFKDVIHWNNVFYNQTLSDDILIELQDSINWTAYFILVNSSFTIMKKFITKVESHFLRNFKLSHFDDHQMNELQKILDLKNVFQKDENKIKLEKTN